MRAPQLAREIDARLDGKRHARRQRQVVAGDDVGLLVHRQPDAVAGAVHEVLGQSGVGQHVAGGGVDLLGGDPRADRGDGRAAGRVAGPNTVGYLGSGSPML